MGTKQQPQENTQANTNINPWQFYPKSKGLGEKIRKEPNSYGINVVFKPHMTLRDILVKPKDKTDKKNKTGVVYHIKCKDCGQDYIGETQRQFKERIAEHRRKSSVTKTPVAHHIHYNNHKLDEKEFKLFDQEFNWCKLGIKEAIHIRKNSPALNQDEGRHRLTHTWNPILKPVSGFCQLPA